MSSGFVVRVVDGSSIGEMSPVEEPLLIGREGDLIVRDPTVSRRHARVEPTAAGVSITDLGSAAGVVVDDEPANGTHELGAGARVELGHSTLLVLRLARFHDAASAPAIRIREQGRDRVVELRDGLTIGREPTCGVTIADATVSRVHATIHVGVDGVVVEDNQSANGTRLGGRPVRDRAVLTDGAVIELGSAPAKITFSKGAASQGPLTVRVSAEGTTRVESVVIEADPDATVAEVTRELAAAIDAPDRELLVYRLDDGALLHPDDRWSSTGPQPGDELVLGAGDASALPAAPGRSWPKRRGTRLNQLPRTVWPEPAHSVERIDPPESTSWKGRGILWQVMGGLGAVAVGLALVVIKPDYAVFGAITGGIGIVTIGASILGEQSRRRHRVIEYRRKLGALDQSLTAARTRQAASLHALSPTTDELETWLATTSPRIWERRPTDPDALRPTLGTGTRSARIEVERATRSDSPLVAELDTIVARHHSLERVPVIGPGPDLGSFGITGDVDISRSLTARIVIEAALLHPPHQLRIWVAASDPTWDWCQWLPHVSPESISRDPGGASRVLAGVTSLLEDERAELGSRPSGMLHLVVVPEPSRTLGIAALPAELRGRGLLVVATPDSRDLPNGVAVICEVDRSGQGTIVGSYPDAPIGDITVATIDEATCEQMAVTLGRLDGAARSTAPSGLLELLGLSSASNVDVAAAWARGPSQPLQVAIGSDDSGAPLSLGFRTDGPHGMIAGTTGSGKSELLQTILTGLALTHTPEQLNLFLIDFKGGATFATLAPLPHVVGIVTDLENDSSLARRAFTALDAEIERRKRVLDEGRVANLIAYERLPPDGREPLPNLLVVIDEFALLVERQPEVKDRLDTIATQGRSLGIHLLLATQSPSGVITHSIRTNTNLWICLRVVTDSESVEILGAKDAARLPDGTPGRGLVRLGASDDLRSFQAARIARPVPEQSATVRVTRLRGDDATPTPTNHGGRETTELELVVDRIVTAAAGRAPATPLWLPPLAPMLAAGDVIDIERPDGRLRVLVGIADHPERQAQEPFTIDLSSVGNTMFGGMFGYGKTTALLQVGADLARHHASDAVYLYGIDAGTGSLGPLTAFPHTGDVVGANDIERLTRLLDRLSAELDARREQLALAGVGDFLRWRGAGGDAPWIVLLLDDYPSFREVAEQVEMGRPLERFNSLLQNGPAVGIHVVLSVTQGIDLRMREASLVPSRVFFRAADVSDYTMVEPSFRAADLPDLGPGRALVAGGAEMQVCWPAPESFAELAARWPAVPAERRARRVIRLPSSVARDELPTVANGVALGVGGPDVVPVSFDIDRGVPALLVAGPIGSGRSSTLLGLVHALVDAPGTAAPRLVVIAPRPSPLRAWAEAAAQSPLAGSSTRVVVAVTAEQVNAALDDLDATATPGDVLVIDDAETLGTMFGAAERIETIVRAAAERRTRVLVGARVNDLPGMFDPWSRYLVSLRRAVLLQPTIDDAFLFGTKLPVIPPPNVAGRGVLIDGTHATVLQVAHPVETAGHPG